MMPFFQTLNFMQPLALWGLLALPVIWWLLRATPPRPREQLFPPIEILARLKNKDMTPDKMPWWLLLLRLTLAGLIVFAVAHPFQRKGEPLLPAGNGPLLLVMDDGWAAATDWQARQQAAASLLADAGS
jgi:Aerotolerance regulator N-terminal